MQSKKTSRITSSKIRIETTVTGGVDEWARASRITSSKIRIETPPVASGSVSEISLPELLPVK